MTLPAYLPILFLLVLSTGFAVVSMFVASKLSPRKWTPAKLDPYECGIVPEEGTEGDDRFPIKFYLIAMMFIIFDIETVFLYPWAVAFKELALFGLIEMGVFVALLVGVYIYVWKRGGLEWAE